MSDLESKLLAGVDAILGPGGLIARGGKGRLRFNSQQHDYARRAARGFARYDAATGKTAINMLQAATGTGKTLGYLVPLMLFAVYRAEKVSRVAVSTFTRHLQKQILDKDAIAAADWVAQFTGTRLSVGLRMGIGNFVSARAAAALHDALSRQDDARYDEALDFLDDLIDWAGETDRKGVPVNSGLLHDFIEEREIGYLPFGVTPDAIALDHAATDDEKAAYLAMVTASKDADVLVVNHSLLVTNALYWSSLLDDPDKRPIAALVCDEADRLPVAAEAATGAGLPLHKLQGACRSLGDEKAVTAAARLQEFVATLKVPAAEATAIENRSALAAHLSATLKVLRPIGLECANALAANGGQDDDAHRKAAFLDLLRQAEAIAAAIDDRESTAICSWSPVREYPSLRVGRPHPGRVLSRLWNLRRDAEDKTLPPIRGYLDAVLMTSATLETPGRDLPRAFDEFAADVGVVRHVSPSSNGQPVHNVTTDLFARFEPAKFGRMRFVLATPAAPLPSQRNDDETWDTTTEWLDYVAVMVRAAHAAGGRTLALALSWKDTAEIGKRLSGMDGLIVHAHGQSLREVVAAYAATENATLVTPSGWEGLDLPGLIQQLVITRIPFAPPDASLAIHRRIHYEHLGYSRDKISAILHNESESATRRKLAQGIGRGIRDYSDDVTLWIGDPRFPLPESFGDSLDPEIINAPARRVRSALRFCVPQRFRETTYPRAQLFLEDGRLHTLSDIG